MKNRSLVSKTLLIFAGMALGNASIFITNVATARYLSPAGYGVISLGFTILTMGAMLSELGLPTGLTRQISAQEEGVDFWPVASFVILSSISLSVVIALGWPLVDTVFSESISLSYLLPFVVSIPLLSFVHVIVGGFRGLSNSVGKVITQNITYNIGQLILVSTGVIIGVNPNYFSAIWVLSLVPAVIIGYSMITRYEIIGTPHIKDIYSIPDVKWLLKFSLPMMVSMVLWMALQHIDNIYITVYLDAEDLGLYNSAYNIARMFLLPIGAASYLYLPEFTSAHRKSNKKKKNQLYNKFTKWLILSGAPVAFAIFFNSRRIIKIVFGAEYSVAGAVLSVLTAGFVIHLSLGLNDSSLVGIGRTKYLAYANTGAVITNIILNSLLIPQIGIMGAGIASVVSLIAMNAVLSGILYYRYGIYPKSRSLRHAVYCTLIVALIVSLLHIYNILGGFMATTLYACLHIVICILVGLTNSEKSFIKQLVRDAYRRSSK